MGGRGGKDGAVRKRGQLGRCHGEVRFSGWPLAVRLRILTPVWENAFLFARAMQMPLAGRGADKRQMGGKERRLPVTERGGGNRK